MARVEAQEIQFKDHDGDPDLSQFPLSKLRQKVSRHNKFAFGYEVWPLFRFSADILV